MSSFLFSIEGLMVALVGRPVLWLTKFFRWPILLAGIFFNNIGTYNPVTQATQSAYTMVPLLAGIILFAVGTTVSRYDELAKSIYDQDQPY